MKNNFYDIFHKESKVSYKIINKNNYTYHYLLKYIDQVLKDNPNYQRILDYGCGVGTIDFYLASRGYYVLGVDISSKAIKSANNTKKILGINNVLFRTLINNKDKCLKNNSFDLVICSEVLEHIPDDRGLLVKFNKYMRKGGDLILSVPSDSAPLFKIGLLNNFDKKVGHIRRYNFESIKSILLKSNFKILDIQSIEGPIRNMLFTIRSLNFLIRYIKFPLITIFNILDNFLIKIFGASDIVVLAKKI
jgi:2-polyprenyl-3-methyl-5-hydroxy-6-metoxy-1,4-benzoquinol methylase